MKYVKIPDSIVFETVDKDGNIKEELFPFDKFILNFAIVDEKVGKSMSNVLAAVRIQDALKEADDYMVLDNSDWEMLKDIVENPSNGYVPAVALKIVDFMKAITDALDYDPRKEE